ncbi:hypothetical protein LUU34_01099800 [Aix galericulata]|nr:hypothetical protein LUU34_01099800 [Aix galericulata]
MTSPPQEPAGQRGTRGQRTPRARSPPRDESSSPRGLRRGEAEPCAAASLRHGLPSSSSSTPNNKPVKSRVVGSVACLGSVAKEKAEALELPWPRGLCPLGTPRGPCSPPAPRAARPSPAGGALLR